MKTFLLKLLGRVANAFREADYTQGRDAYLRSYGAFRTLMTERRATPLPIGDAVVMSLLTGSAWVWSTNTSPHIYAVSVYDGVDLFAVVHGYSREQASARATQLVSALDGARRL